MNTAFVLITVDLENPQTPAMDGRCTVDTLDIYSKGPLGITRIMDICEQYGVCATFFANVYENAPGVKMRSAVELITKRGHEVQLHTHPVWVDPDRRLNMHQLPLDEQVAIIEQGKELLAQWSGTNPIAHRAGAYGLNEVTLQALRLTGLPVDCSMYYDHPNCMVNWGINRVIERDGLLEIPVTGFHRQNILPLLGTTIRAHPYFVKTDIDACSLFELTEYLQSMREFDLRVMTLFVHSYSLITFNRGYSKFRPNQSNITKLESFLSQASKTSDVRFLTVRELWEAWQDAPDAIIGGDDGPVIKRRIHSLKHVISKIRSIV